MLALRKGYAEAVTHLEQAQRVEWLDRGPHIILKPGRKWRAALTDREIAASKEQFDAWEARQGDSPGGLQRRYFARRFQQSLTNKA
jgi:hypothetical protein